MYMDEGMLMAMEDIRADSVPNNVNIMCINFNKIFMQASGI